MSKGKPEIVSYRTETGKFCLKLSSVYETNCSEQKCVEISEEILQAYLEFDRADERLRNFRRRHINKFVTSDEALERNCTIEKFDEDYQLDRIVVKQLKEKCGERTYIRAVLHYLYGMTIAEIAQIEKVSETAIDKSLKKVEKALAKTYNIPYET